MSRFASFVRTRNAQPTAAEIAKAEIVTDVNVLLGITTLQDKYKFDAESDLSKALTAEIRKSAAAEIIVKEYENGEEFNVILTADENGNNRQSWIVFGNKGKEVKAARKLKADEIKKLTAGVCWQGEEMKTDTMEQAGKLYKVPRKYVQLP